MTTRADGRGGSTPPRPAAPDSAPGKCFVFKPWLYDVDAAIRLLRTVPRPPQPLPVMDWARAYGLIRDSGSDPHAVSLIGERTLAAAGTTARPAREVRRG